MATFDCNRSAKSHKQQEYWESMLKKQEERNDHLSRQKCEIRHMMALLEDQQLANEQTMCLAKSFDPCLSLKQNKSSKCIANVFEEDNICAANEPYDCQLVPQKLERHMVDLDDMSLFSMHSNDFDCMRRVKELTNKQACLQQELATLQRREEAFKETLVHAERICTEKESEYQRCICESNKDLDELEALKQANIDLMEANRKLSDDVEDLQLEYAQYKENISGPLSRQLDREKTKAKKLQQQLQEAARASAGVDSKYVDEIYALQKKLDCLTSSCNQAAALNKRLGEERLSLMQQYDQMQEDLVNLKINEGQVIQNLSMALKELKEGGPEGCLCEVTPDIDLSCKCHSLGTMNKTKPTDSEERPKTAPGVLQDETSPGKALQNAQDDQAAFGEEEVTMPREDNFEERVMVPTQHTPIVYDPDGEQAN